MTISYVLPIEAPRNPRHCWQEVCHDPSTNTGSVQPCWDIASLPIHPRSAPSFSAWRYGSLVVWYALTCIDLSPSAMRGLHAHPRFRSVKAPLMTVHRPRIDQNNEEARHCRVCLMQFISTSQFVLFYERSRPTTAPRFNTTQRQFIIIEL
jgi:hypothetical protein